MGQPADENDCIGKANWKLADDELFFLSSDLDEEKDLNHFIGKPIEMCTRYSRGFEERKDIPELSFFGKILSIVKHKPQEYLVTIGFRETYTLPFRVNESWGFIVKKSEFSSNI